MIEISFGKLLLLALIALIVLGPEKLPGAARTAGALVRRLRNGWDSVRTEVERELQIEEIRRAARETATQAEAMQTQMRDAVQQVHDMARDAGEGVQREAHEIAAQSRSMPGTPAAAVEVEGLVHAPDEQMAGAQREPAMLPDGRPTDHPDAAGTLRPAPIGEPLRRRPAPPAASSPEHVKAEPATSGPDETMSGSNDGNP